MGIRAGITNFDLVGTGTEPMVSITRSWRLDRRFYLAASLPAFSDVRTVSVAGFSVPDNSVLLLPELTVGLRPWSGRVQPYVGVGAGWAVKLKGPQPSGPTLHATAGAAFQVAPGVALTATALARSVRPWAGSTVDLLAGVELGTFH